MPPNYKIRFIIITAVLLVNKFTAKHSDTWRLDAAAASSGNALDHSVPPLGEWLSVDAFCWMLLVDAFRWMPFGGCLSVDDFR